MLQQFTIEGGAKLKGTVSISGAKNAALPIACASLLSGEKLVLNNTPKLTDIYTIVNILEELGVETEFVDNRLSLRAHKVTEYKARYDLVRKMRGSFLLLGPLLSRYGIAEISMPGGCAIGHRPIDIHLQGLAKLGAEIDVENGYIKARGKLRGAALDLDFPTVTGTENLVMAATLAKGETQINNAAREPEIVDLCNCLISMGAKITGQGSSLITVEGVEALSGTEHNIIPDRLETVTYAIANVLTQGEMLIVNTKEEYFEPLIESFSEVKVEKSNAGFLATGDVTDSVNLSTAPFPGLATDLQAQMMVLAAQINGVSKITENIYENRFMHVPELCRMGADITIFGRTATIHGGKKFKGAPVMATDLRASVSLVLAGLCAEGTTTVNRIYHLDRGYCSLEKKLNACGAKIIRSRQEVA